MVFGMWLLFLRMMVGVLFMWILCDSVRLCLMVLLLQFVVVLGGCLLCSIQVSQVLVFFLEYQMVLVFLGELLLRMGMRKVQIVMFFIFCKVFLKCLQQLQLGLVNMVMWCLLVLFFYISVFLNGRDVKFIWLSWVRCFLVRFFLDLRLMSLFLIRQVLVVLVQCILLLMWIFYRLGMGEGWILLILGVLGMCLEMVLWMVVLLVKVGRFRVVSRMVSRWNWFSMMEVLEEMVRG